ncbi:MAG: hypothetical protein MHM6MM_000470 [Cercozoa sp. M6MM]
MQEEFDHVTDTMFDAFLTRIKDALKLVESESDMSAHAPVRVSECNMSELHKADGALTCCSLVMHS